VRFLEHPVLVRFGTSCAFNRLTDEVLRFELNEESHVRLEAPDRPDASFSLRRECEGRSAAAWAWSYAWRRGCGLSWSAMGFWQGLLRSG